MGKGHASVVGRDQGCMPGSQESEMRYGYIWHMAIGCPALHLRGFKVRYRQEWPSSPSGIPGEDVSTRMTACKCGLIRGYRNGGDGPRLDGCSSLAFDSRKTDDFVLPFVPGPIIVFRFWL